MINLGKHKVLGVLVDAVDYDAAVEFVVRAARERRAAAISALAVHGVMTGVMDSHHLYRLNHFDLIVPDGQPVRWALQSLYGLGLPDRVYGPDLMLKVCERAATEGLPIFMYGSTAEVLADAGHNLLRRYPTLKIAGTEPSKFRRLSEIESDQLSERIRASGASVVFAALGCPRQEVWAYEFRERLQMPVLAVGAAFPFIAGQLKQAPRPMQRLGLEWLFRLWTEPRRLWRRYLLLNPAYLSLLALQATRLRGFQSAGVPPPSQWNYG